MAIEKSWSKVGPVALLADGTADGLVVIPSTIGFYVKQEVTLLNDPEDALPLQIKAVLSKTHMIVGRRDTPLSQASDITAYLAGAQIYAEKQSRPAIPEKDYERASFAEEPIVAKRTILVDELGEYYSKENPLPVEVEIVVDDVTVDVKLDAFSATPDSALSVGSENGTINGTRHVMKVGADLNLRVKDEGANASLNEVNTNLDIANQHLADIEQTLETELNEANTHLSNAVDELNTVNDNLDAIEAGINTSNGHLTDIVSALDTANSNLDEVEVALQSVEAKLDTVNDNLEAVNSNIQELENTAIDIEANTSETNTQLTMANATLDAIETALSNPLQIAQPVITAGTQDGSPTGPVFANVNNIKQQILATHDREQTIEYADFGTKDQRITQVLYSSPTFPGVVATKTIGYVIDGNRYKRTSIVWTVT